MPILPTVRPDAVLLEEKAAYNRHLKVKVENAPKPSLEEIVNSLKCEIAQKEGYIAGLNYVKGFDGTKQLRLVVDLINSGATTEQIKRWCEVQINKGKP